MENKCESCGMPMTKIEDFGGKLMNNKYCVHCTDDLGKLKPFDQKLSDMTGFIMRTSDLNKENAAWMAKETMRLMPAWKSFFDK